MLCRRPSVLTGFIFLVALLPCVVPQTVHADRIVLRNLEVITDKEVTGFDEDGVRFQDGSQVSWDRIESGRVSTDQQARFDQLLGQLGSHLYRIRQRLLTGDYRGLLTHAESVYPRYSDRRGETAYMVFQALVWSRLAAGQREGALEPYLRCYECLKESGDLAGRLPGDRRPLIDLETGLTPELPPIWFDTEAAKQAVQPVSAVISGMNKPRPAGRTDLFCDVGLGGRRTAQGRTSDGGIGRSGFAAIDCRISNGHVAG